MVRQTHLQKGIGLTLEARLKGIRLQWSKWKRPSPETIPAKTKAAGLYMICTLSKHAAEADGFDDALMLDWRGRVAEATGANIFLVIGGACFSCEVITVEFFSFASGALFYHVLQNSMHDIINPFVHDSWSNG